MPRRRGETKHGTPYAYEVHACRCVECRAANAARKHAELLGRRERIIADPTLRPHGTYNTGNAWGCPCQPCRDAVTEKNRIYARARRMKSRGVTDDDIVTPMQRYKRITPFGRDWLDSVQR